MANAAQGATTAQYVFSPLVLCDSLLSLARDADRAGLHVAAAQLLDLATSVLDEKPVALDLVPLSAGCLTRH